MNKTDIHLWTAPLSGDVAEKQGIFEVLSPDERRRAGAFRFAKHRNAFIVARALLRHILSSYLQQPAKDITFTYGSKGKPALDQANPTLHFNLAHSENRVVYAFSKACELGVDIESVRHLPEFESIARSFFSPGECAQFLGLPADQQDQAFFSCWTRKEAYLKATGDGLMVPLNSFQVSLLPGEPAAFVKLAGDRYPISQWNLFHLDFPEGHVGALAIPSPRCTLHWRSFADAARCFEYLADSVSSF